MTRGGKRAGAGRPRISETEDLKKYTFKLLPSEVPYIKGIIKRLHEQKRKQQKEPTQ